MNSANRVAQVLAVILGLVGMYLAGIALVTIYGALQASANMITILSMPILIVGIVMVMFSYRALFRPSEKNSKSIALIYAAITLLYSGSIIERLILQNDIVRNPRVVASGSTIILAILVFYGIKIILEIKPKE